MSCHVGRFPRLDFATVKEAHARSGAKMTRGKVDSSVIESKFRPRDKTASMGAVRPKPSLFPELPN